MPIECREYIIRTTDSSFCPHCDREVDLLSREDVKPGPAFYICWKCKFIGQVGVGPVQRSK